MDSPIVQDLGWIVMMSAAMLVLARRWRIPPILSYMAAGLLLGPVSGVLGTSASLDLFSELGVALLLFTVGMELGFETIRAVGKPAILGGALQVLLTAGLGWALALGFGFDQVTSLVLGLVAAFSSTVVVVKLLEREGRLATLHGRLSIGILLVQDVVVALVLTMANGLVAPTGEGSDGLGAGLATASFGIVVLSLAAGVAVRWVLPRFFAWLAPSTEGLFIAALSWAFAFILAAEAVNLSIELGALIAGVALAQLPYNEALRRRVHPLVDFFLAVFFVSLGARMQPVAALALWPEALALTVFIVVAKPLLVALILAGLKQPRDTGFLTGVTLGQASEFALILCALAAGGGIVSEEILSLVGVVALATIAVSAMTLPAAPAILGWLEARSLLAFLGPTGGEEPPGPARSGHVVIVGMNTLGRRLIEGFRALGHEVLAVDTDPRKLADLDVPTLMGNTNSSSLLHAAETSRARLVVSTLRIEEANALLTYRCERMAVPVAIHAFDPSLEDELLEIGADYLMISKIDGIRQLEAELRRLGVMG